MATRKMDEVILADPRLVAMRDFDVENAAHEAKQTKCPDCGGYEGYNPVTGVQLLTGHHYNCKNRPA